MSGTEIPARFEQTAAAGAEAAMLRRSTPLPFNGTGSAKDDNSMPKASPENQIAGGTVQKLPGGGRTAPPAEFRAGEETLHEAAQQRSRFARPGGETVSLTFGVSGSQPAIHEHVEAPTPAGGAGRVSEQLLLNLTREVAQFKRFNAESMAVVLKPDANTEIFLHLAMRNGQVDVQARFERGDFSAISGQWQQLQQTMAQQGVRLSPLQDAQQQPQTNEGGTGQSQWGHGQPSKQRQEGRDDGRGAVPSPLEDLAGAGAATEPLGTANRNRRARSRSILEAWA